MDSRTLASRLEFWGALFAAFVIGLLASNAFSRNDAPHLSGLCAVREQSAYQQIQKPSQFSSAKQHPWLYTDKVAVLIEPRAFNNMIPLVLHYLSVLGPSWAIHIYHSAENMPMLLKSAAISQHIASQQVVLVELHQSFDDHDAVSKYLTGTDFWAGLAPYEFVLLFQLDTILCSASPNRIEDFFEYDFIGAPILATLSGGDAGYYNGGLSLRRRSKMLEIAGNHHFVGGPGLPPTDKFEDQWFVHLMRNGSFTGMLPSVEVALNFSIETIYSEKPLGVHQAGRWAADFWPQGALVDLARWCPEIALSQEGGPSTFGGGRI